MTMVIPYGRQQISQEDIDAVVEVLRSDFLTQGPAVSAFERSVAEYCGAAHAVAVNSATSALHIACLALGVGRGDVVWTSPITFVASANCALYCGATVDFVDVDSYTANMCPERLATMLERAERDGRLPKVVIPVHVAGEPCDMAGIHALRERYGFSVIEDASHAIGARYRNDSVGNCRYSDITVFSFHPVKIITTGEGGVAVTNDAALARKMERLRTHGVTRDATEMSRIPDGPWYYEQIDLGFNYRMTDMQAALGRSQLARLDAFVARRHEIADAYDVALSDLPLQLPRRDAVNSSSLHLYVIRIDPTRTRRSRREIYEGLKANGIGVNVHYMPVYLQPYYRAFGFTEGYCLEAERYYAEAISLPMFPGLTAGEQERVVTALRGLLVE